jgi:hypothetical protein
MGNIIGGEKNVENNEYDSWCHCAVQGDTLDQIEERIKSFGVTRYKYETLGYGEMCYNVAFPGCMCELPDSWMVTAASFKWFLKNGHIYTDVEINGNKDSKKKNDANDTNDTNDYENWELYPVQGYTLDQISEILASCGVTHYKYRSLFGGYFVAFPPFNQRLPLTKSEQKIPKSWSPSAASFSWLLKQGHVYTDVNVNKTNDANE